MKVILILILENHLKSYNLVYKPNEENVTERKVETLYWETEQLEKSLEEEKQKYFQKLEQNINDNYIQEYKSNMSFQAVANFIAVNYDYLEKSIIKAETPDQFRERLKIEYDISLLASLNQRLSNISTQNAKTK